MTSLCHIRAFAPQDAEAVARIYGHYVLNGTALSEAGYPVSDLVSLVLSNLDMQPILKK